MQAKRMEDAKIAGIVIDIEDEDIKSPPRRKARFLDTVSAEDTDLDAAISASLAKKIIVPLPDDAAAFDARVAAGESAGSCRPVQAVDPLGEDAVAIEPTDSDLEPLGL